MRIIIWKQLEKIRKIYTCLKKLGISHRDAYVIEYSRRSYYSITYIRAIERVILKERLNKRGLVNSLDHYIKVNIITS